MTSEPILRSRSRSRLPTRQQKDAEEINKYKRENNALRDELKHLKRRLASTVNENHQKKMVLAAAVSQTHSKLQTDNELLETATQEQVQAIRAYIKAVKALEKENQQLKAKVQGLEKGEIVYKKVVSELKVQLRPVSEAFVGFLDHVLSGELAS
ncbi:unnamed protein product [Aureobasidium uvarum]|uniref:Uncharacterized protein n=1 Tax=Aureobasidium uvarum TaxID=2773716 RepID=A0A9N8KAG9_9PEZI|nr:unnamed protein product [Aureobasidium uvarum]